MKDKVDLFPVHEKTSYFSKSKGSQIFKKAQGCFQHIHLDMKFLKVHLILMWSLRQFS